eukprot:TRINITY_DN15010_c0_g1_i2.p1 TRINITY_DN15010_c0_g1~~TRINITY_DN15010_c0_g1_i2.p1  ORF type:complete len:212 (+),score=55.41 TRINITY_DN15010_c0_g1_i2:88-723(+)
MLGRRTSARGSTASAAGGVDYAEEGRKLLEAVNLGDLSAPPRYSPGDALWRHPTSGATFYVGGQQLAMNRDMLRDKKITRIVNCQDSDGRNYFADDPEIKYLKFEIGRWRDVPTCKDGDEGTWQYFEPYFSFCMKSLAQGHNVLVHCLAGAHRAGTAGIAFLMLACGWDSATATAAAQKLRPAINPIGGFPTLLAALDKAGVGKRRRIEVD